MKSVLRSLCVISILQVVALGAARAGDDEQAKQYFIEGKQAYQEGRYHAAVASFRAAAAIRPSPILEFNIARCFEKLGQHDDAIAAYEKYLASAKDAQNRDEVKARVAKLKEERRKARAKDPYEEMERTAPGAPPAPRPPAAPLPGGPAAQPASRPFAMPPPPRPAAAPRAQAEPAHEASLPRSWGATPPRAAAPQGPTAPAAPPPPPRDEGPVYKKWWFWVALGAGAVLTGLFVTTVVYAAGGSGSSAKTQGLEVRF